MHNLNRNALPVKIYFFDLLIRNFVLIILIGHVLFFFPNVSRANDDGVVKINENSNANLIKKRLHNMYKIDSIRIEQDSMGRLIGSFLINGDLTPRKLINNKGMITEANPKIIARSFLIEQADLFGISNFDKELKERAIKTDEHGWTSVFYYRYINEIRLKKMEIIVHITDNKKIFAVNGISVPFSSSVTEEVTKKATKSLSENEIRKIIEDDLGIDGITPKRINFLKSEKFVIPSDPYLVWEVDVNLKTGSPGRWIYLVDAITGDVIEKRDNLQSYLPLNPNSSK